MPGTVGNARGAMVAIADAPVGTKPTDPECVVDEIERNRYLIDPGVRSGIDSVDLTSGVRHDVAEIVARDGAFVMTERHGLFTCR